MARSLSNFLLPLTFLLGTFCNAATVTYDFNITWTKANPDGAFERAVIGINEQWPIPQIRCNVGDRVIVNAHNGLGNVTTSLHFHGLFQNGTTSMDGPAGINQCPIPPGSTFTYNFTIDQPGTYWYHSHVGGQYPDGLRGPLIVEDPNSPYKDQYDEEVVLTFSDWYHQLPSDLIKSFISYKNPTGAEPVPDAALMNDTQNVTVKIEPGKTYLFRMVNMAAFAAQYVWFEGHTMRIVEVDGVYTEPADANMIYITAAQRYSVLITAKNDTDSNFAIQGSMDQDLFDKIPATLNPNVTGWLVYDDKKDLPAAAFVDAFEPFDDYTLVPTDGMKLLPDADHTIELELTMENLGDGANYAAFNGISYTLPKVPTLYTVMTAGNFADNSTVYGTDTNPFVLEKGQIVDIIVNNNDPGKHPFHLHGHNFQLIARSAEEGGFYANNVTFPQVPMRRDTVLVRPNGNIVLRFVSDNPGVWLFHCHIEWHMIAGLAMTLIENPLDLQKSLQIPQNHYDVCAASNYPVQGNAAGNTKDLLDLTGQTHSVGPLPAGFTARGIVALVFSCVAAFVGMAVISWYGIQPVGTSTQRAVEHQVAEADLADESIAVAASSKTAG
ncbi:uncharacterized protein PV09_04001 [Verruconis gallopava]|uniref:Iron transport multicopper oxidase FET3 n=1 Tax=Verruconis gallopava TaxID=253628 RepID=A0A0D1XQC7_9PEZI|nr:uncharacterized protein PV09_04001 [Verruconis gallopava]KIW04816.1 hypothetical protein PV09_04001 [Verruconis gallopava]